MDQLPDFEWIFDVIHPDPNRRQAAIARHLADEAEYARLQDWSNDIYWRAGGTFSTDDVALSAEFDQAWAARRDLSDQMMYAPISHYLQGAPADTSRAPFTRHAVLYLQWETRYPAEWTAVTKGWHTKKNLLRLLARRGPTPDTHGDLLDLVEAAINREQRCEDGRYPHLARSLDPDATQLIVARAEQADDPLIRLRAGYVRWALANPALPVTLASWRAWLRQ